ncbi:MAG: MaoC/PaaZ C-terminal domain-containing protein [Candidatus Bathyarchaeota archaeon]|nr:MaoC/PaaZ C-terminal domain-containing protein [Candidatus Bathyarchaeota archaeon]
MDIKTHLLAHKPLLGTPVMVVDGEKAVVQLVAIENMVVDDHGLIHGGFTFGLADYAAMLAVNDPYVVIVGANVSFVAPVMRGDVMIAEAEVAEVRNKKRVVNVVVNVDDKTVFRGELTCFVLDKHVLDG